MDGADTGTIDTINGHCSIVDSRFKTINTVHIGRVSIESSTILERMYSVVTEIFGKLITSDKIISERNISSSDTRS